MSLAYGLNVKKKAPAAPVRRALLDDEDELGDAVGESEVATTSIEEFSTSRYRGPSAPTRNPTSKSTPTAGLSRGPPSRAPKQTSREDASSLRAAEAKVKGAEEMDASIFDYDSFHDAKASVTDARKAAARQDAIERKPKYIGNLLDAAARRKQDQQVAREKVLQREREEESDEFADKEKFVTGAYKQQQEETRRLEEEERQRTAADEERRRRNFGLGSGSGMQTFYREMMDNSERQHRETLEAATARLERGRISEDEDKDAASRAPATKSDAALAAEMAARGVTVHLNDDGQITDKRQLLSAGLNVGGSGRGGPDIDGPRGADHLRAANQASRNRPNPFSGRGSGAEDPQAASRERQTRMVEEQLEQRAKRAREEEEAERARVAKAAKTTKTETDVGDARARYLARKAARERGEG